MDIALLNVRIIFQKNSVVADAIGNRTNAWQDYYSCHATVNGEAAKDTSEANVAGAIADNSEIAFTVRYCQKASVIDSTGYRVLFNGEIYDIVAVDHMNFKRKNLKFKCRKARR